MDRLLLVEDDYALALGIEYSLKAEGYEVVHASNLKQARDEITDTEKNIDLVLLDVMLPDGTGYELCRELREQEYYMPVIFLTAVAEEANIVQGLELGADDYVAKPFRVKELLTRIKALLRRQKQYAKIDMASGTDMADEHIGNMARSEIIYAAGYEVDLGNYRIYRDGNQIDCTLSEFRLLKELLTHKGQVLTREQLVERLWDIDGNFIDDNTLSVYMKRLRDKLPELKNCIHTIRGVGYQYLEN